jgi:RNA polymerase sigma factor (sigma-70 family)
MPERSDGELVILSRQGNKKAFGSLIERYQKQMGKIAMRMVGNQDTAQDLVQEAMLQAYLSLKDLRKDESFRSWLYGIVLNLSKSYLRDQKRRSFFGDELDEDLPEAIWILSNRAEDPEQTAIERELHRLVLIAIDELPTAHREAARMYYYESLTLHEISAITGASTSAIKVRLHRARNHLREKLSNVYPERKPEMLQKYRRKTMIKANIVDIIKRDEKFIILLQDEARERILPIWVGEPEGRAIAMGMRAYPTPRPMTFDFMAHLFDALGAQLEEARIEVLKDATFYGIAIVRIGNEVKEVDARPSDVLALAVRTGSPILVTQEVMQQASKDKTVFESETGRLNPGEGMDEILKEFDEAIKKYYPPSSQTREEDIDQPVD